MLMSTTVITSLSNAKIKNIRKLRNRKAREASGLAYIEGLKIVGEALEAGMAFQELIWCPELLNSDFGRKLVGTCEQSGVNILEVNNQVFESISLKDGPQGIAAVIKQKQMYIEDLEHSEVNFGLALFAVADPGNLGTIIRTCDAVGCQYLFLLDQATDPYDPNSVRASMGALFSVNIIKVRSDKFLDWTRQHAIMVAGSSDKAALDYVEFDYPERMIFLMGSEREGLPEEVVSNCSKLLRIPMMGKSDSLNLSIATGVLLYEYFNRQRVKQYHQGK